jgi:16S rRNA G966 N2-methylase RsmD
MDKYLKLDYPYYNLYYKFNKKNIMNDIKNFSPEIYYYKFDKLKNMNIEKYILNNSQYFIIKDTYEKTSNINNITDYFSESVRVKCKFGNYLSPKEYWDKNKIEILKKTYQKYKKLSIYNIRETIFYNTKLCNNFRVSVALSVLQYFKPNKWLDISAGWGDRLLSAIFYKIKLYVSTDPNLDLHPCYQNMVETFVPESKRKNFIIYKNGFLEAPIKEEKFDIVFSSPPFFTLEIYSDHKENSVVRYNSEKSWCDNFFVNSLIKAYNLLKKNGHIILYMGGSAYVMNKMHLLDNIMEYKGQIYFYEKIPRGMFVWKKIKNNKITSLE